MAEHAVELTVKPVARVAAVVVAAIATGFMLLPGSHLATRIVWAVLLLLSPWLYRRGARFADGRLEVHGLRRSRVVDFSQLKEVYFGRGRDRYGALELSMTTHDGKGVSLTVRWWTGWRELLDVLHEALADNEGVRCKPRSRARIERMRRSATAPDDR